MTRACGCTGDGYCESDVEVVQRSKRPAEKSRCCQQSKEDAPGAGGKVAKLSEVEAKGGAIRREAKVPRGCRSKGDCFQEEVGARKLPCGCGSDGDCFHEEVKSFADERMKKSENLACGCNSEGDCFHDECRMMSKKLACGCKSEGDCFHDESKKVKFDCGCKAEGDCFQEEVKRAREKDSCCCQSGRSCGQKMSGEHKSKESCCHKKEPGRLACGCKSEGDCYHEVSKQEHGRLACGYKSVGDCNHEVSKQVPGSLVCGCKSEGDCFHEVVKHVSDRLVCGCKSEGDCFHEARKESRMRPCNDHEKVKKTGERLELSGPRTDEVYRTFNIPTRFMYPKLLKGYRDRSGSTPHPCYLTTSTDYGWFSPTVHTVPTTYYPRDYAFSVERSRGGMYRNCSLNTELDKHFP